MKEKYYYKSNEMLFYEKIENENLNEFYKNYFKKYLKNDLLRIFIYNKKKEIFIKNYNNFKKSISFKFKYIKELRNFIKYIIELHIKENKYNKNFYYMKKYSIKRMYNIKSIKVIKKDNTNLNSKKYYNSFMNIYELKQYLKKELKENEKYNFYELSNNYMFNLLLFKNEKIIKYIQIQFYNNNSNEILNEFYNYIESNFNFIKNYNHYEYMKTFNFID